MFAEMPAPPNMPWALFARSSCGVVGLDDDAVGVTEGHRGDR